MCLALANMNCRGSSCELHGWFDSCTAMVASKPRHCWAEVMTFFGVSSFQRVKVKQGSLFPTLVLARFGMGMLNSGGPTSSPNLYCGPRCFPSQGNVTDLCSLGDMRGTQTTPEPPNLSLSPLWEPSCTCVQWEQFGVNSSANPQCSEWCCSYGAWGEIMLN